MSLRHQRTRLGYFLPMISVPTVCSTSIPKSISNLVNLKVLTLTLNHIKKIPSELKKCQKIEKINLYRNPIKEELSFLNDLHDLKYVKINESCKDLIPEEIYDRKDIKIDFGQRLRF